MPTSTPSGRTAIAGYRSNPSGSVSTRYVTRSESAASSSTIRSVSAPKSTSRAPGSGISSGPCATRSRENGDDFMDLRPAAIRADVEASLRRLGVDRVDLLQIHDRDPSVPVEETWGAVLELVAAGKVRHGGISNHRADEIERAL